MWCDSIDACLGKMPATDICSTVFELEGGKVLAAFTSSQEDKRRRFNYTEGIQMFREERLIKKPEMPVQILSIFGYFGRI